MPKMIPTSMLEFSPSSSMSRQWKFLALAYLDSSSSRNTIISRRRIQLSNQMLRYTRHLLKKWWGLGRLRYWHDMLGFRAQKLPTIYSNPESENWQRNRTHFDSNFLDPLSLFSVYSQYLKARSQKFNSFSEGR